MHIDHFWKTRILAKETKKALTGLFSSPDQTKFDLPMDDAYQNALPNTTSQGESSDRQLYPRPQMERDSFYSLNGPWEICPGKSARRNPQSDSLDYSIQVPYAPESSLSGYEGPLSDHYVYRKLFSLPRDFNKGRILLHFGAVDQLAQVYFNGFNFGTHKGGYLPFSFDITDLLLSAGEENELIVKVTDSLDHTYPYGKQTKTPGGMWYTPFSGIWQSVWLESVENTYIEKVTANYNEPYLEIEISGNDQSYQLQVEDKDFCQSFCCSSGQELRDFDSNSTIMLTNGIHRFTLKEGLKESTSKLHFWSPEDPFLYPFTLRCENSGDSVSSYFALRSISIEKIAGHERLCLNHRPYFFHGVLDQGYFSQGLVTPPYEEFFSKDILAMKNLGFNTLRKHLKIEPARFYYECDRLGMVVFQDMVNNGDYHYFHDTILPTFTSKNRKEQRYRKTASQTFFLEHSMETVSYLKAFPSVLCYTVFNEGWGQFASNFVTDELKKIDSSRIYDSTSGWFQQKGSDLFSDHAYFHSIWKSKDKRPRIESECGGFLRLVEGHSFCPGVAYGYGECKNEEALSSRIIQMYDKEIIPKISQGMSGAFYTQLSDIEEEVNGLYTYDRAVCKVNAEEMKAMADRIQAAVDELSNEDPSQKKPPKTHHRIPLVLRILLIILLLLCLLAGGIVLSVYLTLFKPGTNGQMRLFTNFLMQKLTHYDLDLLMEDENVKDILANSLGQDYVLTCDELYDYFEDAASYITYDIIAQDPEAMTTTVQITCADAGPMFDSYLDSVCDYIFRGMDQKTLDVKNITDLNSVLADAENAELIHKARTESGLSVSSFEQASADADPAMASLAATSSPSLLEEYGTLLHRFYSGDTSEIDRYLSGITKAEIKDCYEQTRAELSGISYPEDQAWSINNSYISISSSSGDASGQTHFIASSDHSGETELPFATKTYEVTLYFQEMYHMAIPYNASPEIYDVATAGLYSSLDSMEMDFLEKFIPRMVERIFGMIQSFDLDGLEEMTGNKVSDLLGIEENSSMYATLLNYFKTCAGKITYEVSPLDTDTMTVRVACNHLDSEDVLKRFVSKMVSHAINYLLFPDRMDELNNQYFLEAANESAESNYVNRDVVISFHRDQLTEFEVSEDIYDVITANMYTLYPAAVK